MFFKNFVMLMLAIFIFASCKKDTDSIPAPPANAAIEGMYAAKYGFDEEAPNTPEKYNIKAGGVFQQISINNGSVVASGTWQLNGNILTATCTSIFAPYSKESIKAIFNSATGKLTGTWGWESSYINGGKMEMTKQ